MGRKKVVMPWIVTAYERPERIVFEYGRPFPATAEFSFRADQGGTVVTCDTELRPRGLWRMLAPVMAAESKKIDAVQFQKEILEARSAIKDSNGEGSTTWNDHPKAVVRRFYQIINDRSPQRLDEVCSQDLRGHAGAGADLSQLKQSIGSFAEAFLDQSRPEASGLRR